MAALEQLTIPLNKSPCAGAEDPVTVTAVVASVASKVPCPTAAAGCCWTGWTGLGRETNETLTGPPGQPAVVPPWAEFAYLKFVKNRKLKYISM